MFRRARDGRRRRGSLLLVVITLTAGLVPLSAPSASASARIHIECDFHHRNSDDPIVYPRKPGKAHLHLFFGNKSTNAFSTWASLRRAGTNCNRSADKAAYWMPAVYRNGSLVKSVAGHFYYRGVHHNLRAIKAYPPGLKIIAGNHDASRPQSTRVVAWSCQGSSSTGQAHMRDCGAGGHVKVLIKFPSCWDGRRKDSANHKAHMRYATRLGGGRRGCPRSHPVPVPELTMAVSFAMRDGAGVKLSSGPFYTMHADFFNAWSQTALKKMIHNCIHANKEC
ncbi:MAG TPA: DUF1996 domain-containing protein [Actinomycetota bacterium]|jgi:hypothetical protein|nr:DUF1996 domain-containing protein [Actinomycetota bacterium]